MFKRSLFLCALMMSAAVTPVRAEDVTVRMDQLEEQVRQLTGQVEQLTYQLKQMQAAAPAAPAAAAPKKFGAVEQAPAATQQAVAAPVAPAAPVAAVAPVVPSPVMPKKNTVVAAASNDGVEQIGDGSAPAAQPQISGGLIQQGAQAQPIQQNNQLALAPKPQGMSTIKAAQANDGGFQGKVLVPAGGDDQQAAADPNAAAAPASAQTASLEAAPQADTPDDLYMRANQALLQRRFDVAATGFQDFITKYPEHNLAGSAEFWLGETYWAQQDFSSAAQAYLNSYKKYPKGRRAPDSLLKLGQSLSRLGQKDQACATIGSVDTEYPNAVDVKKRAQAEFKREGCSL